MKYILKLKLNNNTLKSDYRRTFISFFKNAISKYMDGVFYDNLYNSTTKKSLTWSVKLNSPKFQGTTILLGNNNVEITLKISDPETALIYFSSIIEEKGKVFNIGNDNQMILKSIKKIKEKEILYDLGCFKILSPICLRRHNRENNKDWYYSIGDKEFQSMINEKLKEDIDYMDREIDSLSYNFDYLKKTVVPLYGLMIPVTIGKLLIEGDKRILNHINQNGLGSRRNSGFGLLEIIS